MLFIIANVEVINNNCDSGVINNFDIFKMQRKIYIFIIIIIIIIIDVSKKHSKEYLIENA